MIWISLCLYLLLILDRLIIYALPHPYNLMLTFGKLRGKCEILGSTLEFHLNLNLNMGEFGTVPSNICVSKQICHIINELMCRIVSFS